MAESLGARRGQAGGHAQGQGGTGAQAWGGEAPHAGRWHAVRLEQGHSDGIADGEIIRSGSDTPRRARSRSPRRDDGSGQVATAQAAPQGSPRSKSIGRPILIRPHKAAAVRRPRTEERHRRWDQAQTDKAIPRSTVDCPVWIAWWRCVTPPSRTPGAGYVGGLRPSLTAASHNARMNHRPGQENGSPAEQENWQGRRK